MKAAVSHLAIIPDGNRRLARRLMEQPWKGHEWGVEKLYTVLDWCREAGIKTVTFYALSLENLAGRPKEEVRFLFLLAGREFDRILTDRNHFVHRNRVRLTFFGRLDLLPRSLQEKIRQVTRSTKGYAAYQVNVAMAYGGRQEILAAAQGLLQEAGRGGVTEKAFRKHLQTNGCGDPDLIIRTGGEKRLSNFLPFQSVYSELAFIDSFWPELSKKEFFLALKDFSGRQRRFGK